jgi:hypothetical protein
MTNKGYCEAITRIRDLRDRGSANQVWSEELEGDVRGVRIVSSRIGLVSRLLDRY